MKTSGTTSNILVMISIAVLLPILAAAQNTQPATQGPAWSPAKSIGLYAYPKNKQSADQQLKDESDCYGSARQNTGIDPQAPAPTAPNAQQQQAQQQQAAQQAGSGVGKGGTAKGAGGGATGGAAIGAIAGDAGKGAAIGATVGAVGGRRKQKKAEAEAKQEAAQQTAQQQQQAQTASQSQHREELATFKRAFSACMDARVILRAVGVASKAKRQINAKRMQDQTGEVL
jgi:Glycine-zipper domain